MPKITVLMPVYNAASHLAEAIDSILGQTFTDFDFLIINDGSTDDSEAIILGYPDPRIRYYRNERNQGLVDTLNRGIERATGPYIARMDADDISLPTRFAKQVAFMEAHPEVGACGTAYQFFGDSNALTILPSDPIQAFTMLHDTSCLGHPTSMIRRDILIQYAIRYENEYQYAADYAVWIRISQVSPLSSLSEPLLLYRWHSTNMSRTDPSRNAARTKARILWHELMLGRPLEAQQKEYLYGNPSSPETFRAGKKLILAILNSQNASLIDKKEFGASTVSNWERKYIALYGFRGLINCLLQPDFRRWSRATLPGLVAQWVQRYGIRLKR